MTELYRFETRLEAWVEATSSLLEENDQRNIILHIESPESKHTLASEAFEELDAMYRNSGMEPIHTVSDWIFPSVLYNRGGLELVFDEYPEVIQDLPVNWGTYFERMIRRKDPHSGEEFNPLKRVIEKLETCMVPDKQTYHSCYELEMAAMGGDLALYRDHEDRKLYRNLPCLSHISFNLFDGELQLTALYRSHDYRFKVPGNLRGLARLQDCVATEIGADVCELVVHSTRATINKKAGKPEFQDFVFDLKSDLNTA